MKNLQAYQDLASYMQTVSNLQDALSILHWDQAVMMPKGSLEGRIEQVAAIQLLVYQMLTSQQLTDLIGACDGAVLDEWQARNAQLIIRQVEHTKAVPQALQQAMSRAASLSEMAWRQARSDNDFAHFIPSFTEVVTLAREVAAAKAESFQCGLYDACLENFEPGLRNAMIEPVFSQLASFLPDFIAQVIERQQAHQPVIQSNTMVLDVSKQQKLIRTFMMQLGFDFERGRLDTSDHPFCGGTAQDIRITMRYQETKLFHSIMDVVHEAGHALYEKNRPQAWIYQPISQAIGMATHESQSLLMEMQMGRSPAFAHYLHYLLAQDADSYRAEWDTENIYCILNKVGRSHIRVDADEVTYPAHILVRHRLEKALMEGTLAVKDIPGAWAEGMQALLGITPPTDREGCLQDIHWPNGSFGYFPCYTLGAIMAAAWYARAKEALPQLDKQIAKGNFTPLVAWLATHIHSQGSRYTAEALLTKVTGKGLDVGCYTEYLQAKFLPI